MIGSRLDHEYTLSTVEGKNQKRFIEIFFIVA